jgi:predicted amidophosphoribosyltransferase
MLKAGTAKTQCWFSMLMRASFGRRFMDTLLPPLCVACGDPSATLCARCLAAVEPDPSLQAAFLYSGAVRQILRKAKFRPDEIAFRQLLALWKNRADADTLGRFADRTAVTFVPSHWRRRLTRGFDTSALFAKEVACALRLPLIDALRCRRLLKPSTLADDKQARAEAALEKFALRLKPERIANHSIVLIDDIITTGTTLASATHVLSQTGASVCHYVLARTPSGDPRKTSIPEVADRTANS